MITKEAEAIIKHIAFLDGPLHITNRDMKDINVKWCINDIMLLRLSLRKKLIKRFVLLMSPQKEEDK